VALAECCLAGGVGAEIELPDAPSEPATAAAAGQEAQPTLSVLAILFGEGPGGFLVSGEKAALDELATGVSLRTIGAVGGDALSIAIMDKRLKITLAELARAHARLEELFQ
jgi:hypothetical protein